MLFVWFFVKVEEILWKFYGNSLWIRTKKALKNLFKKKKKKWKFSKKRKIYFYFFHTIKKNWHWKYKVGKREKKKSFSIEKKSREVKIQERKKKLRKDRKNWGRIFPSTEFFTWKWSKIVRINFFNNFRLMRDWNCLILIHWDLNFMNLNF
jgi:hypothetical protein